jgi:hypothetical protein
MSTSTAADECFVLGEPTIKSFVPSTAVESTDSRLDEDVKQLIISAERADVQRSRISLRTGTIAETRTEGCGAWNRTVRTRGVRPWRQFD